MSVATQQSVTFTCDACGATATSHSAAALPAPRAYRAWARLAWEQSAGFDYHGVPWANRVNGGKMDLCEDCADEVMAVIEAKIKARAVSP